MHQDDDELSIDISFKENYSRSTLQKLGKRGSDDEG